MQPVLCRVTVSHSNMSLSHKQHIQCEQGLLFSNYPSRLERKHKNRDVTSILEKNIPIKKRKCPRLFCNDISCNGNAAPSEDANTVRHVQQNDKGTAETVLLLSHEPQYFINASNSDQCNLNLNALCDAIDIRHHGKRSHIDRCKQNNVRNEDQCDSQRIDKRYENSALQCNSQDNNVDLSTGFHDVNFAHHQKTVDQYTDSWDTNA